MFCPYPFTRLEIKANGNVYCCCEGWLPTPFGNVLEKDLMEIWNGEVAESVRRSVLDSSFRYCKACPYLPGPRGPLTRTMPDRPTSRQIQTLKLDYDPSCNLACQSCRVVHSRHFANLPKAREIHEAMLRSGVLGITNFLYVTGSGDPFASELFWHFLKTLHEHPRNPDLQIFLHTNGLLFDQDHWVDMGKESSDRVSDVGISVDAGTPETYRKIRGASWQKLWDNIAFINRLQAEPVIIGRPIILGFFYTVQAENFREILPFVRKAWSCGARWISITALRNWGTYAPDDYLRRAVHLPSHPNHDEFRQVLAHPEISADPRIVVDSFDPRYTDQEVIGSAGALLPENQPRKKE